ncbi:hypothetical protein EJB05_20654 [Eragrostis curvula]|uniref:Uncharacterized protein n=1 Tax=Eragrostis curvula TaxID=38414 RepID=A0A5J9UZQ0_9POAL|nr:hypothetical protein EJB05_20654 [Eragrostis curvula]
MSSAAAAAARKLAGTLAAGRRISQSCGPSISVLNDGLLYRSFGSAASVRKRSLARRIVSIGAISLTGGLTLSAVNDLAIFHGCTTKAIEKASDNPKFVEAIGMPIARGPWYDASLEVGHRRRSVSCTFSVSGPHGSGLLLVKASRNGEDGMLSFLRHHDWEILDLEAHFHVPSDGDEQNTLVKVNLASSCGRASNSEEYEQPKCDSQAD